MKSFLHYTYCFSAIFPTLCRCAIYSQGGQFFPDIYQGRTFSQNTDAANLEFLLESRKNSSSMTDCEGVLEAVRFLGLKRTLKWWFSRSWASQYKFMSPLSCFLSLKHSIYWTLLFLRRLERAPENTRWPTFWTHHRHCWKLKGISRTGEIRYNSKSCFS